MTDKQLETAMQAFKPNEAIKKRVLRRILPTEPSVTVLFVHKNSREIIERVLKKNQKVIENTMCHWH